MYHPTVNSQPKPVCLGAPVADIIIIIIISHLKIYSFHIYMNDVFASPDGLKTRNLY
jgi:hypothetical protein